MPEPTTPTCCPDAYWCQTAQGFECPRHGGFTVCCEGPSRHVGQDREAWHRQMEDYERSLLNNHITAYKIFQAFGLPDGWAARSLNLLLR